MIKPVIKDILSMQGSGGGITVEGWIRTKRESKGVTFLEVNDGSTIRNLQVVLYETFTGYGDLTRELTTGSSAVIRGTLIESPGQGQAVELKAESIDILGAAPVEEYALQKKRHS